jgi:DNA polymerase-3 subunit alpha
MNNLEGMLKYCQDQKTEKNSSQASLFGLMSNVKSGFEFNQCEPWGLLEKLNYEFTALSFFLSSHPLEIYSNLDKLGSTDSVLIPSFTDGTSLKLVGVVLSKIERTSKNSGQKYAFLQMSDTSGIFEVAVFSEVFQKSRDILTPGTALFIQATIRYDGETYRLIASQVTPLEESLKHVMRHSRIHINENVQKDLLFRILKNLDTGHVPLSLNVTFKDLSNVRIDLPIRASITPEVRSKLLAIPGVLKIENF